MKNRYCRLILLILLVGLIPLTSNAMESNDNKILVSNLKFKTLNTGQGLCPGSTYEIEWQGINARDTVVIYYSTNSGTNWVLVTDTATGLKYTWHVPNTPSPSCIARITEKHTDCSGRQSYSSVTIGNQVWMGENLDVCTYQNGDPIPQVTDFSVWSTLTTGAWCYYNNDPAMGAIYGKLYNWFAVNDPRGLAPLGWHVPSDDEWTTLTTFLGGEGIAGGKLKSTGTKQVGDGLWDSPNTGATNSSGFSALGGGYRNIGLPFMTIGNDGSWWSTTEYDSTNAWGRSLYCNIEGIIRGNIFKGTGFSVRCLKDSIIQQIPHIDSISPSKAFVGEDLILYGTNFGATQGTSNVSFTGADAIQYSIWTNSQIKVKVPVGCTSGKIYLSVNGINSNEVDFSLNIDTVQICNQVWMKKNLDVTNYRNGDLIPQVMDIDIWKNLKTGAWCYYDNIPANGNVYGKLYNWYAVNDSRGLAPAGWHVPSDDEWTELETCLGGATVAGGKLKTTGTIEGGNGFWLSPNTAATNESRFSALPGGVRFGSGPYEYLGHFSYWWTSSISTNSSKFRYLRYNDTAVSSGGSFWDAGLSVRCVKD